MNHFIHSCDLEFAAEQYREWYDTEHAAQQAAAQMGIEDPGYPEEWGDWNEQEYDFTLGRVTTRESAICEHARKATFIHVQTGSEGPHYDPYSYTELTVDIGGLSYLLHTGLIVWLQVDRQPKTSFHGKTDYQDAAREFERLTGMAPDDWESYYQARVYFDDPMGSLSDYE